jgi:hypothetical protein
MLSSELAAGNMIRAKQGKREIAPYLWVHPDKPRSGRGRWGLWKAGILAVFLSETEQTIISQRS